MALSTVGFGDIAPLTPQGRAVITVAVIVGLCLIPSEASLVATALQEEQRLQEIDEMSKREIYSLYNIYIYIGRSILYIHIYIYLYSYVYYLSTYLFTTSSHRRQDEQEAERALAEAERAEAQLAWDAARIAELENETREERKRLVELERKALSWQEE